MTLKARRLPLVLFLAIAAPAVGSTPKKEETIRGPGLLWREPLDLSSRNLFYGCGGRDHQPRGPYRFVKEDLEGSNPKFDVVDGDGVKWKVKLGQEARPETVASRLVWSVGYFTTEDYLVRDFQVVGMPAKLKRGRKLVAPGGIIDYARFKRTPADEKKAGIWDWKDPAWAGNRELDGLKTLMALINNWDLKDVNNAVYEGRGERIFLVSDLGASFGTPGRSWPTSRAKDDLEEYRRSAFIRRLHGDLVDFQSPARPGFVMLVNPKEYLRRVHLESIGRNIPREHARWIGQMLARLSERQIRDAFSAAGYPDGDAGEFTRIVQRRIARLTDL
ncbi:MAG TPA: hypothetical protein VMH28_05540 [Candidatus Acidoferrales bacterium]|nr:hypothetical protein [Candidatus Acidoferrales bacterium]